MFDLSLEKLFILAVVALFVLGPERLPAAASWLAKTIRQIKDYATDANHKIRSELGPEFDEIREPLNDLRTDWADLRTWRDPRAALIHHLRDDPITTNRYSPQQAAAGHHSRTSSQPIHDHGSSLPWNAHPSTPRQRDTPEATGRTRWVEPVARGRAPG